MSSDPSKVRKLVREVPVRHGKGWCTPALLMTAVCAAASVGVSAYCFKPIVHAVRHDVDLMGTALAQALTPKFGQPTVSPAEPERFVAAEPADAGLADALGALRIYCSGSVASPDRPIFDACPREALSWEACCEAMLRDKFLGIR